MAAIDVYLVPVGTVRYELYCESAETDHFVDDDRSTTGGVYARFREMVSEAQEDRRARRLAAVPADPTVRQPWIIRLRNLLIAKVAETIAEFGLLWHLRKQSDAALVHPDDLDGVQALAFARDSLQRDTDRHRRWLIIDSVIAVILGPVLFFVPGPNLIAYYFTFRAVGHLLAWRGARHGVSGMNWTTRRSEPLAALRQVLALEPDERVRHVRDVEGRLGLEHLAAFVERTVVRVR